MDDLDFQSFFNEKVKARGLTLRKLSDLSGIALNHLENLSLGNFSALPAAPYLRGYLRILGRLLDFDPAVWYEHFAEHDIVKSSGAKDELPFNRYALRPGSRYAWIVLAAAAVLLYFGFRFSAILGRPELTISYPAEDMVQVASSSLLITGTVKGSDEVRVNNEPATLENGSWSKQVNLQRGINPVEVTASKFLGQETKEVRQIVYEPPAETPNQYPSPTPTATPSE